MSQSLSLKQKDQQYAFFSHAWERTTDGGYVSVNRSGSGPPIFKVITPETRGAEKGTSEPN